MGPGRRAFSLPWMGHQVIGPKDVPQPPLLASAQHRRGHSPHYSLCQIGHRTSPGWLSSHTVSPAGRGVSRSNWNSRGHNLPGSANFTPQGLEIIPEGPCSACAEKHLSQPSASSPQAHPILPEVTLLRGLLARLGAHGLLHPDAHRLSSSLVFHLVKDQSGETGLGLMFPSLICLPAPTHALGLVLGAQGSGQSPSPASRAPREQERTAQQR